MKLKLLSFFLVVIFFQHIHSWASNEFNEITNIQVETRGIDIGGEVVLKVQQLEDLISDILSVTDFLVRIRNAIYGGILSSVRKGISDLLGKVSSSLGSSIKNLIDGLFAPLDACFNLVYKIEEFFRLLQKFFFGVNISGRVECDKLFIFIDKLIVLLDTLNWQLNKKEVDQILHYLPRFLDKGTQLLNKMDKIIFPENVENIGDIFERFAEILGPTLIEEAGKLADDFIEKSGIDDRVNDLIDNVEDRAFNFIQDIQNFGSKLLAETSEDMSELIDDKLLMISQLADELLQFANGTIGRIEDLVDESIERVESIVDDVMILMDNVLEDIDVIEKKLMSNLWNMLYNLECITETTTNAIEVILAKLFSIVGSNDQSAHPCLQQEGYQVLDELFSNQDPLKMFAVSECLIFYDLGYNATMLEFFHGYTMLDNNIKMFKCYSDGKLFKQFFVQQEKRIANVLQTFEYFGLDKLDDLLAADVFHSGSFGYYSEEESLIGKYLNIVDEAKVESIVYLVLIGLILFLVCPFCCCLVAVKSWQKCGGWFKMKFVETGMKNRLKRSWFYRKFYSTKAVRRTKKKYKYMNSIRKLQKMGKEKKT